MLRVKVWRTVEAVLEYSNEKKVEKRRVFNNNRYYTVCCFCYIMQYTRHMFNLFQTDIDNNIL